MKKLLFILVTAFFCGGILAQCPTGNVTLTTQQQINNFAATYPNCTEVAGWLRIVDGNDISDLSPLSNITSIGEYLRIFYTNNLVSLTGLENLTSIGADLRIIDNTALTDITALNNVSTGITGLRIYDNPQLTTCNATSICNYLANGGVATVRNNDSGCDDTTQVSYSCMPDGSCGIPISLSQQDIDDFSSNYPGCTVIEGNLRLDDYVTDLSGLNQITAINGNFNLSLSFFSSLTNFSGLENLETIGGNFTVEANYSLENFEGLESLTSIGGDFVVNGNNNLNNFLGLDNLSSIGGDFVVNGNNNLNNFLGLDALTSITGNFNIDANIFLENLDGLNNLTTVGGNFIVDTNNLMDISALSNLTSIGGSFDVKFNDRLTNLSGLENLNTVGGRLEFSYNNQLTSLSGLESLSSIGGELKISSNYSLTSLAGIANIDHTTITDLTISGNDLLSICGVNSICNYLAAEGTATISGNKLGCDTQSEVESVCNSDTPCSAEISTDLVYIFDQDIFIDGVGFANNPTVTFTDPATPSNATLSDISLELYFRLNGASCENEIAMQITDPAGNTQPLTAYTTCDGGTGLYYVNLNVPSGNTTGSIADWVIEFDDTNDQNSDYEYSVRFARLKYTTTTVGSTSVVNEVSDYADSDLFIDGVGFANNGSYTFTDPSTPANAVLSDISLELYFRLNGSSCENEIAIQITDPAGNMQALTAYATCDGGTGLYYVNLNVPSGNTTGSVADWLVEFDDTNDQNSGYEYSVRFGRLTYTTTIITPGVSGTPVTVNETVSDFADADLFIDGVGFENNDTYTFTDAGTPADATLSNISLELYFRLTGASCENEIAIQITDPAGNTQPLTAYTTCDGGTGLYYVNLTVPSGNTSGSVADWVVEFDDTNDQNSDYEYSVRFGRLTYDTEYTVCVEMLTTNDDDTQQVNTPTQENIRTSARQDISTGIKLYPVPASQYLNVEYFSENANSTNIEIISNAGKILMRQEAFSQEGINTTQLDIAELPAGHYHIRMYSANDVQMQSFIKIAP